MAFPFRGVDYMEIDSLFSEQELLVRQTARQFVEKEIVPIIDEYNRDGKLYRFDVNTQATTEVGDAPAGQRGQSGGGGGGPARGRQFDVSASPDTRLKAFYRDRNLWLSGADASNEIAITTDGNEATHVKNGTASWVYGEELSQNSAIWWSPKNTKVAYYRFDESKVPD